MIDIPHYHLTHQAMPGGRVIGMLPAAQLVQNVQAHLVAVVQKMLVGRVMGHPHGIHVHVLHQPDVHPADLLARTAPRVRPERVTVAALEDDAPTVDVDAVAGPQLDSPEAKPLPERVQDGCTALQPHFKLIQVRRLRRPLPGGSDPGLQADGRGGGSDRQRERRAK